MPHFLPLLLLALLLGGCGQPRDTAVALGNRQQILHLGNLTEPNDLDPHLVADAQTFNLVAALFEGLTQYSPQDATPLPAGAERWEVSADNLTWTFHLRRGARWSNGEPVTARDYVFAYRRILSPALAAEYASMLHVLRNGEAFNAGRIKDPEQLGVRARDDLTLEITLERPIPYLPAMTCHSSWFPVHRATLEKFGRIDQRGSAWTRPGNLVGNGAFTLVEWKPNQHVRVRRSDTYWDRGTVRLKEVFFYPIESEDAEERSFRTGQLHATSTLPISKIATYEKDPAGFYHPHLFLCTYFYRFNVNVKPLDDVRVRRALALAINREQIVRDVTRGHQLPARHLTPPDTAGFNAPDLVRTDLAEAQRLLAEAGFPGGAGFPQLDLLFNTNEGHRQIAEAIQQMWRKGLGIGVRLYNQEGKVYTDTMRAGNYQIARFAWAGDYIDPSTFLDIMASDSGNNQTGWKNAEYDRLLTEARSTVDQARRWTLYRRCEEILAAESPIAPIYFYARNNLVRPEVKGWYGNLLDQHPLKGVYLDPDTRDR